MEKFEQRNSFSVAIIKNIPYPDNQLNVEKNVDYLKECGFMYSLRPIYYFSRLFGLMPFSILYDSNGDVQKPKVRFLDGLWFTISISVFLSIVIASVQEMEFISSLDLRMFMIVTMGLIFDAIFIVLDMFNRVKLVDIFKKFVIFDKAVRFLIYYQHFHEYF